MNLQDLRFGIEIETVGQTRGVIAGAIQSVVGGTIRYTGGNYDTYEVHDAAGRVWKVMADGSLNHVGRDKQAEVVSPVLTYSDIEKLQEVVRAIRKAGAKVDAACGIHIHVDASAFEGRQLANLARLVYKQEPLILAALQIQQRRLQTYTKPTEKEFIKKLEASRSLTRDEVKRLWYGRDEQAPTHYDSSRYHGVNLHSVWYRGTVEFRWFEATLHAGKIKAYVQFVLALAAKALNAKRAISQQRTFSQESAKYDFRCFLLRLGMIGEEFATARLHLLAAMPGDAAFKRGRPTSPTAASAA